MQMGGWVEQHPHLIRQELAAGVARVRGCSMTPWTQHAQPPGPPPSRDTLQGTTGHAALSTTSCAMLHNSQLAGAEGLGRI